MPTALMNKVAKRRAEMNGQLDPLKERMTASQLETRKVKIAARRTAHEQLQSEQRRFMLGVAQAFNSYFKRGFFGRLKWLLVGR